MTYPHANGYADHGKSLVLVQNIEGKYSLIKYDLETLETSVLTDFAQHETVGQAHDTFFDIAADANTLVYLADEAVWLLDIDNPDSPRRVFVAPEGETLGGLLSIKRDGSKLLAPVSRDDRFGVFEVDIATCEAKRIIDKPWWANHYHYCPHDESWIGFCHEGKTTTVPDRVWAYHPVHAPDGRQMIDQHFDTPADHLCLGHERWCFHDTSVVVVAYGESESYNRGIFEAFVDGRPKRLISRFDRDWHVNITLDGKWAVVDTTGPHDEPGRSWENAGHVSDVMIVDMKTGGRQFIARSRLYSHPSHPHPIFSPDSRWIFYNEADESFKRNRVMRVANPWT
ncbi:MAG TPA: oligogalacturonate lyase family protein [Capsulimonadaceae bacterium]|jgi:hypothetical protein